MTPAADSNPPGRPRLLTRDQVVAELRRQVNALGPGGMTWIARHYGLQVQQVSDVLAGRARLSRRMWDRLGWEMWEFFVRKEEGGGEGGQGGEPGGKGAGGKR
jgi:hypothetical protein